MAAKKKQTPTPGEKTHAVPEWCAHVPVGMIVVYNRLPFEFSVTFNANQEFWGPYEFRMVGNDLAKHCERRGMYRWDPLGTKTVMALVDNRHKFFGVPLPKKTEETPKEVLVRNRGLDAPVSEVTEVEVPE